MTATATTSETSDLIGDLTDKAIAKDIGKYERMIEGRQDALDDIKQEISELEFKRDALLDEQIKRLSAKKRVVKPAEEDGDE